VAWSPAPQLIFLPFLLGVLILFYFSLLLALEKKLFFVFFGKKQLGTEIPAFLLFSVFVLDHGFMLFWSQLATSPGWGGVNIFYVSPSTNTTLFGSPLLSQNDVVFSVQPRAPQGKTIWMQTEHTTKTYLPTCVWPDLRGHL